MMALSWWLERKFHHFDVGIEVAEINRILKSGAHACSEIRGSYMVLAAFFGFGLRFACAQR
jgi:hypothetical protein